MRDAREVDPRQLGARMRDAREVLAATIAALRAQAAAAAPDAIVAAEVVAVEIPFRTPIATASGTWTRRSSLLVLLRDAGGAAGLGEITLPPATDLGAHGPGPWDHSAEIRTLASRMVGRTPSGALDLLVGLRERGPAWGGGGDHAGGGERAGAAAASSGEHHGAAAATDVERAGAAAASSGEHHGAAAATGGEHHGAAAATDVGLARATAAGFEAALLDLAARRADVGLAAFLHAALAAASLPVAEPRPDVAVSALVAAADADVVALEARAAIAAGHACVKLKVGDEPDDAGLATRVGAVRAAIGPGPELRLDANAAWTLAQATGRLAAVAPYDVAYVEQPVVSIADLAALRSRVAIRIAADESVTGAGAAAEVLARRAADALVVKVSRVGGIAETLTIAALAHERGVPVVLSSFFETGVGLAAALNVAAVLPGPDVAHGLATGGLLETDLLASPLVAGQGRLALRDGPGLGIDLDPAAVAAHRPLTQP